MQDPRHTQAYAQHLQELETAQKAFDLNPNRETATLLSNTRNARFSDEEKYTPEALKQIKRERSAEFGSILETYLISKEFDHEGGDQKRFASRLREMDNRYALS